VICVKNNIEYLNINDQVDTPVYAENVQCLSKIRNKTSWSCLGFNHQVDTHVYAEEVQSLNETPKKIKQNV
jgi:hypothetical protein